MLFDWAEYLRVAHDLSRQSDDEAWHRSPVSRAYYAAFGTAARALMAAGHTLPIDGTAHEYVWSAYRNADDGPLYYIGQDGARLRKRRRAADYDAAARVTRLDAEKACREAETAIKAILRHPAPIPLDLIS